MLFGIGDSSIKNSMQIKCEVCEKTARNFVTTRANQCIGIPRCDDHPLTTKEMWQRRRDAVIKLRRALSD